MKKPVLPVKMDTNYLTTVVHLKEKFINQQFRWQIQKSDKPHPMSLLTLNQSLLHSLRFFIL